MWYLYIVVFIESVAFSRRLRALTGTDESSTLRGIQNELIEFPSRGDLVPGLGGIRKARFGNPGRGKGSVEVIATFTSILNTDSIFISYSCWIRTSRKT
jgi:hypothetical protein